MVEDFERGVTRVCEREGGVDVGIIHDVTEVVRGSIEGDSGLPAEDG
jgi:hypothetical protein